MDELLEKLLQGINLQPEATSSSKESDGPKEMVLERKHTKLERYLNLDIKSSSYIEEENYDEAYGLLSTQMKLGKEACFAPVLINYYYASVSTGRFELADSIKQEVVDVFRVNLNATPKECELLGDKYRNQEEYIKSILVYQVAEALSAEEEQESDNLINCLQGCALGLKLSGRPLAESRTDLRVLITRDVVPAMRRIYQKLRSMSVGRDRRMILIQAQCLHHIETTELEAENPFVREKTLREALEMMQSKLGEDVVKYHLYSAHLNNLAVTCMSMGKPEEAVILFEQAIEARNSATDYDTKEERMGDLAMSQRGLKEAQDMLE